VDRRLPNTARPARLKAQALPYVNDWQDKLGWGSEALEEERLAFWDSRSTRLRKEDISKWELANALIVLIPNAGKRRALWHWSIAKAGGRSFAKWCRNVEHVHPMTGDWRRRSAIECIFRAFARKTLQHNKNDDEGSFTKQVEKRDNSDIITNDAPKSWMAHGAKPMACDFDSDLGNFNWAERRNEMRRQRDLQARKQKAA
jgi:hypothetical protein